MKKNIQGQRLLQLLQFEWRINRKRYLWSGLAAFGFVTFIFIVLLLSRDKDDSSLWSEDQLYFFFPLLWGVGSLFTHVCFPELSRKESAISFMMIPATTAEKILVKWIYTGLLFTLFFIVVYLIVSHTGFAWFQARYEPLNDKHGWHYKPEDVHPLRMLSTPVAWSVAGYLIINGALLLGTVYIRRFVYVKTALALFSMVYLIGLFLALSPNVALREEQQSWSNGLFLFRFARDTAPEAGFPGTRYTTVYELKFPESVRYVYLFICMGVLPLLLNLLAYKKLQEKEI